MTNANAITEIIQLSAMGLITFAPFAMFGWSLHPLLGTVGVCGVIVCVAVLLSFLLWSHHVRS